MALSADQQKIVDLEQQGTAMDVWGADMGAASHIMYGIDARRAADFQAAQLRINATQAVGEFVCRAGGCTMDELVKKFGVEAHPMRAKIHAAKHQLGFKIEYDHEAKRYAGTAP